jgi:hypothetical protein
VYALGKRSITSAETLILLPVIGTMLIDSTPPATMASTLPKATRSAARAMAWRPDEQKRLMVMPEVVSGRPPRRPTTRAMLRPCSPSGIAHPRMRSSTSLGSSCGTLAIRARIT